MVDLFPDQATLQYLQKQYKVDSTLFIQQKVYGQIDSAIQAAKENLQKSQRQIFDQNEEETDVWVVEPKIDISKGLSIEDYKNIMCIKRIIHSYFAILKKDFKANLPKYIVKFLVRATIAKMRIQMQMALRKHEDIISLVYEDPEVRKQREI